MNPTKTILIAEDSDDDFLATERAFRKSGLANPIRRCTNGDQVLDYLYRRGEFSDPAKSPRPGIVLLDLNLPGTDGREVLRVVKSDHNLHKIPVIVLTTSDAERDIERCYDAGANSYVKKPVNFVDFQKAIGQLTLYWLILNQAPQI